MAATTPRFGLNWFDTNTDGELTDDGQKYTGEDRLTIDTVLAALEKHDHHLVTAVQEPDEILGLQYSEGGTLEGETDYYYVISFINDQGLETVSGPESSITTPAYLQEPEAPSVETVPLTDLPSGLLTEGVYYYAITALRVGEESALSDFDIATVLDDEGAVIVTLPALGNADSYQVWRQREDGDQWTRVGTTNTTTFTDDGSIPAAQYGDPANIPPEFAEGADVYQVTITLTGADKALVESGLVTGWRIYRSTDSGLYSAASLVHEVIEREVDTDPNSNLLTVWVDDGDELLTGSPKRLSTELMVAPYTFENGTAGLPDVSLYPDYYPILGPDNILYVKSAGAWKPTAGSAGSGSGGLNPRGTWDTNASYTAGDLVTYTNATWVALTPNTATTPGSYMGGASLAYSTNTTANGVTDGGTGTPYSTVAMRFKVAQRMTINTIGLYLFGSGYQSTNQLLRIGISPNTDPDNMYAGYYQGTFAAGSGAQNFPLNTPVTIPADTDVWLMITRADTTSGTGLQGLRLTAQGGTQSAGLTLGSTWSTGQNAGDPVVENSANTGAQALMFSIGGTTPVIYPWYSFGYTLPAGGTAGQVLAKSTNDNGAYAWATGGGGGLDFQGAWTNGNTYSTGSVVTYKNGLWRANTPTTWMPDATTGGLSVLAQSDVQGNNTTPFPGTSGYTTAAQRFRLTQPLNINAVQLNFNGAQTVGTNFSILFCTSVDYPSGSPISGYVASTFPAGSGYVSFPVTGTITLAADTDYWMRVDWAETTVNPGIFVSLSSPSFQITFPNNEGYSTSSTQGTAVSPAPGNSNRKINFKLEATTPVVRQWNLIGYVNPPGGSAGQILSKVTGNDGDYAWAAPISGGGVQQGIDVSTSDVSVSAVNAPMDLFDAITVAPGEIWDIDIYGSYVLSALDGVTFYVGLNFTGGNVYIAQSDAALTYYDSNGKTTCKFGSMSAAVGNGSYDGGPAITGINGNTVATYKMRATVGSDEPEGGSSTTIAIQGALESIATSGATTTFYKGAVLKHQRIAEGQFPVTGGEIGTS